jgi:hypothetical protein
MTLTPCPKNPTAYRYLKWAVIRARECGLPQEFSDGYRRYRSSGDDVFSAAWCALCDWDMLDV